MKQLHSDEIYAQGYAVGAYNINNDLRSWRHRERVITLRNGAVKTHEIDGFSYAVARWDDVLAVEDKVKVQ